VISDDGARVWADGELILDVWEPHGSRVDRIDLRGGRRKLRVEYYESAAGPRCGSTSRRKAEG
jgi:hypothetical protein